MKKKPKAAIVVYIGYKLLAFSRRSNRSRWRVKEMAALRKYGRDVMMRRLCEMREKRGGIFVRRMYLA